MEYFYLIAVNVRDYPMPLVPVFSIAEYEELFNQVWEQTNGNLKVTDGGLMFQEG